ncbi:MAG: UvrD-helicase domain-containing protein, partial [Nitratireductor sp.]|nr:UvrD-helicase domain-containing protein [Nitratireductor sp.]
MRHNGRTAWMATMTIWPGCGNGPSAGRTTMAEHRGIPLETRQAQALASNPEMSAWVSANAGSGKTFVLARRVIRL